MSQETLAHFKQRGEDSSGHIWTIILAKYDHVWSMMSSFFPRMTTWGAVIGLLLLSVSVTRARMSGFFCKSEGGKHRDC